MRERGPVGCCARSPGKRQKDLPWGSLCHRGRILQLPKNPLPMEGSIQRLGGVPASGWEEGADLAGAWASWLLASSWLCSCVWSLTEELFPNHREGAQQYSTSLSRLGQSPSKEQTNEITHPWARGGRLAQSQPKSETCSQASMLTGPHPLVCAPSSLSASQPSNSTVSGGTAIPHPNPESQSPLSHFWFKAPKRGTPRQRK